MAPGPGYVVRERWTDEEIARLTPAAQAKFFPGHGKRRRNFSIPRRNPIAYHIYSRGGFESGHKTLKAAIHAAKKYAAQAREEMRVYETDPEGFTGKGEGTLVFSTRKV